MKKRFIGYYRRCDFVTMSGTISAFIGILLTFEKHFCLAAACLLICGLCDAFDGVVARMNKYTDEQCIYGGQLDSLSDFLCFGVFPALIMINISDTFISKAVGVFYILCGIIRLAFFNTLSITKNSKKGIFIGLPITTSSIVVPILVFTFKFIDFKYLNIIFPLVLFVLGVLYILRFEVKKPDIPKLFKKIFNKYVINFIFFPALCLLGTDIIFKLNFPNFWKNLGITLFKYISSNIFALILFILIFLLLFLIFNSTKISKIIFTIFTILISVISDIKLAILDSVLEFSDINYLNPDNIKMMATSTTTFGKWIIPIAIKNAIFIAILVIFIIFDKKIKVKLKKLFTRVGLIIITLLLLIFGFLLPKINKNFVLNALYNITPLELEKYVINKPLYRDFGLYQGIYLNAVQKIVTEPAGYKKENIDKKIKDYDYIEKKPWGKANVVFILSEAFTEIDNLDEVKFDKEVTPNITKFSESKNAIVAKLLVPSYGGSSVNTEFEILTGGTLSFWNMGYIPYTQYFNDNNVKKAPSIIKEFKKNNYEVVYLAPWGRSSFNSEYVYNGYGADKMVYNDVLTGKKKGLYYSDDALADNIIEELSSTNKDNYKFIMVASAENHYPFNGDKFDKYNINITESTLSEEDNAKILSYAQGLYDADAALGKLYDYIQNSEVPTIIVFFGDHYPSIMGSDGSPVYLNGCLTDFNYYYMFLQQYTTKLAIISNFEMDTTDSFDYINANYLGAYVINKMDINISNYYKYLDVLRKKMPVYNRYGVLDNENFITTEELNGDYQESYLEMKYLQYRMFYDY